MAGSGLRRGAPEVEALLLAVLGEELGDRRVVLVRRGRRQVLAGLGLEGGLDLGIVEQIGAVEVDLDEGFHRHAEEVAVGVLEVVRRRS